MVIRLAGKDSPKDCRAARTRSLLSAIALSGRPTIVNAGNPEETCTCRSTSRISKPLKVIVLTRASIRHLPARSYFAASPASGRIGVGFQKIIISGFVGDFAQANIAAFFKLLGAEFGGIAFRSVTIGQNSAVQILQNNHIVVVDIRRMLFQHAFRLRRIAAVAGNFVKLGTPAGRRRQ